MLTYDWHPFCLCSISLHFLHVNRITAIHRHAAFSRSCGKCAFRVPQTCHALLQVCQLVPFSSCISKCQIEGIASCCPVKSYIIPWLHSQVHRAYSDCWPNDMGPQFINFGLYSRWFLKASFKWTCANDDGVSEFLWITHEYVQYLGLQFHNKKTNFQ